MRSDVFAISRLFVTLLRIYRILEEIKMSKHDGVKIKKKKKKRL